MRRSACGSGLWPLLVAGLPQALHLLLGWALRERKRLRLLPPPPHGAQTYMSHASFQDTCQCN